MKKEKNKIQKKLPILKIGTHKKSVFVLWSILIFSLCFAIYKNFTAIDQHTTHEKTVVEEKLVDTSGIQSYVTSFANAYFTWQNNKEAIEKRTEAINQYLTEELQQLNVDSVRIDIPTSSVVKDIQILKVAKQKESNYKVTFSIQQEITESKNKSMVDSTYEVTVHQDANGNKVIIQNPTMTAEIEKSNYEPKQLESDGSVDSKTTKDVTKFLETFFKLYPTATEEEISYYVKDEVLKPINKKLVFSEINKLKLQKNGKKIYSEFSIVYINRDTKMREIFWYKINLLYSEGKFQIDY
ncbi:conjugal transfer protein [Enterococcus casseliflavus]|uniref:conjugal transfer protein n=1 Tax=Enterococcus casseliflavus TaxID=37734 RepID=UPI0021B12882|nr:conjugal transfer protein [Enterococcus casseliflavus]